MEMNDEVFFEAGLIPGKFPDDLEIKVPFLERKLHISPTTMNKSERSKSAGEFPH